MDSLVFDTSAILNFGHRGELTVLLNKLSAEFKIFTTPAAQGELIDPKRRDFYTALLKQHFTVQDATVSFDIATLARLTRAIDAAEITVMALARELKGMAVIDERAARRESKALGLRVTGTVGLLNEGLKRSWLTEAECLAAVAKLSATGFAIRRLSPNQSFADYFAALEES